MALAMLKQVQHDERFGKWVGNANISFPSAPFSLEAGFSPT
jgi:hypothetical protein